MKRDLDLIREILLENEEKNDYSRKSISSIKDPIRTYHYKLLIENGYINGHFSSKAGLLVCYYDGLTWNGHEFLDNIRSDSIWNKVKSEVAKKLETVSINILAQLAIKYVTNELG